MAGEGLQRANSRRFRRIPYGPVGDPLRCDTTAWMQEVEQRRSSCRGNRMPRQVIHRIFI